MMSAVALTGANGDANASGRPRVTVSSIGVAPPTLISSTSSGRRTGAGQVRTGGKRKNSPS